MLDERWHLLSSFGVESGQAFLLNPDLSIGLGARWFDELLERNEGDILYALMEHNAGNPALRQWVTDWRARGRSDDVEYIIETVRFMETRIFLRGVISDMAIVGAAGIFRGETSK